MRLLASFLLLLVMLPLTGCGDTPSTTVIERPPSDLTPEEQDALYDQGG